MAEPGENFVFLHKKKNGAVFAKVKTAPEILPAPITNPRLDVSVTNGGSPWNTTARLDVLPTDSKQFDKTSKQTMHVKRVHFADSDKVVDDLPHFSERVLDDEFVADEQPNDDPPVLPKIWPSLLSRRTRSHWMTCQRCTLPWTVPAIRSLLKSAVKR
jgi:hypothetical protein